jgi:hypothetical protein
MAGPLNPPFLNAPSGYILGDFETSLAPEVPQNWGVGGQFGGLCHQHLDLV